MDADVDACAGRRCWMGSFVVVAGGGGLAAARWTVGRRLASDTGRCCDTVDGAVEGGGWRMEGRAGCADWWWGTGALRSVAVRCGAAARARAWAWAWALRQALVGALVCAVRVRVSTSPRS